MTPQHAKMLLNALKDNLDKFEKKFGEVRIAGDAGSPILGFQPPTKDQKFN
jgi:hypothetical protein